MKDAFRKRARGKQPDAEDEVEVAPKPKGKGRGRGRKAKADVAASAEQQVESEKKDETPVPEASGGKPEGSSPNKRPQKSRKQAPANPEDAAKAVKDAWAHKDWCLVFGYKLFIIKNTFIYIYYTTLGCTYKIMSVFRSWNSKLPGSLFLLIFMEIESRTRCQRTMSFRVVLLVCCAL